MMKVGGAKAQAETLNNLFVNANLVISTVICVYILLVFRLLLNHWFAFGKLDSAINLLIIATIAQSALTLGLAAFHLTVLLEWVQWIIMIFMTIVDVYISFVVLKGPVNLFGDSKKLAVSSLASFGGILVMAATMGVAYLMTSFDEASLDKLPPLFFIPMFLAGIAAFVAAVYFVVVLVRMFFAAARTMDRARPPEALATG
ncbi:MAG: hypothetical protein KKC78_04000 [Proteobacteria bacterium]|nr:hypothetical protein [Pseudomonadota bacterium]